MVRADSLPFGRVICSISIEHETREVLWLGLCSLLQLGTEEIAVAMPNEISVDFFNLLPEK